MSRKYEYMATSCRSMAGEQCTPSRPRVPLKEVDEWELINGATSQAPIADTYELDRAAQVKIAEALGELLVGLKVASQKSHFAEYSDIPRRHIRGRLYREADGHRQNAVRAFARILHTCMGGRIPDEVP